MIEWKIQIKAEIVSVMDHEIVYFNFLFSKENVWIISCFFFRSWIFFSLSNRIQFSLFSRDSQIDQFFVFFRGICVWHSGNGKGKESFALPLFRCLKWGKSLLCYWGFAFGVWLVMRCIRVGDWACFGVCMVKELTRFFKSFRSHFNRVLKALFLL